MTFRKVDYTSPIFLVVMDSVRHDQFQRARTPNMDNGGFTNFSPAMSGATWTIPSVTNMMTGRLPFHNGQEQIFGDRYWLPQYFHEMGVSTHYIAAVGIPTHIIKYEWDTFHFPDRGYRDAEHLINKALDVIDNFPNPKMFFYLHFEDTHSPFECADNGKTDWRIDKIIEYNSGLIPPEITEEYFEYLKKRQIECIEFMDKVLKPLIDMDSTMIITSDHGENFGENPPRHFGHDVPPSQKLFEVPLLIRG